MRLPDSRRETAAWSVARGNSYEAAADSIGMNRSSVKRWMKDPEFSARVDELKVLLERQDEESDDVSGEAKRGLARLIPVAEQVVEAAMLGTPGPGGSIPTAQQHANALKTIEMARKFEPKQVTETDEAPSLKELIANADVSRRTGS